MWVTLFSHSAADVPSPGAGNECFSAQESTSWYTPPARTWVFTEASFEVDQNVGETCAVQAPEMHSWSNGTSGYAAAFAGFTALPLAGCAVH